MGSVQMISTYFVLNKTDVNGYFYDVLTAHGDIYKNLQKLQNPSTSLPLRIFVGTVDTYTEYR
jgi:hypothetical protein